MDRFGIANTAVNQRNKIMENRKIFIRAECAPSGTYRADRAPDGRSRSCRRSGPDGAMRFSEFRRSVEPFRTGCSRQRSVCPKRTGRSPPPPVYAEVPPPRVEYALAPHGPGPMPRVRNLVERAGQTWRKSSRAAVRTPRRPAPPSQDNRSRGELLSAAPRRFRSAVFRAAFRRIRRQNPGTALSCPSPPRSDRGGRRIPSARTGSGSTV